MAGLSDNSQAVVMAIAFALAGIGTVALPTSWPWELRIIPALVAAVFAGVKEYLGGAGPVAKPAATGPTPPPQGQRRFAAVLTPKKAETLVEKGYIQIGEADIEKDTYILLEKSPPPSH